MSEEVSPELRAVGTTLLDWVVHSGMEPQPDGIGLFAAQGESPEYGWIMLDYDPEEWDAHEEGRGDPLLSDFYVKVLHAWDGEEVPPIVVLQVQDVDEQRVVYRALVGTDAEPLLAAARALFEEARRQGLSMRKWP